MLGHAYIAGTFTALACGVVGWIAVLRAQVFAADALGHVAFVGAVAAVTIGLDARAGVFVLTLALAGGMGVLGARGRPDDVTIGVGFTWILGLGALFAGLLADSPTGGSAITTANSLFGSILALSGAATTLAAVTALLVLAATALIATPLLFASLDPAVAAAQGVPVRVLGIVFLLLLALVTAEGTQAVGALQILGLLAAPAGAAHLLTTRPARGIALSAAIAVAAVWGGLALTYEVPAIPPSSAIIGLAALAYGAARIWALTLTRRQALPSSA
jgi:zinc/manganese transport system permease protein